MIIFSMSDLDQIFKKWILISDRENLNEEHLKKFTSDIEFMDIKAVSAKEYFILGWIYSVGFWLFEDEKMESKGKKYLLKASNLENRNLYKWAIRDQLNLKSKEEVTLGAEAIHDLDLIFNNEFEIQNYFKKVIT